jgi:hypothetical protein
MAELGAVVNMYVPLVYYRKRRGSMQHTLFWQQQDNLLRVSENMRRRAAGTTELTFDQFRKQLSRAPCKERLTRRRTNQGKYHYRRGSTDIVNGSWLSGATQLGLAAALEPRRTTSGIARALGHRFSNTV